MRVIKIGGNELDSQSFLDGLAATIANLNEPVIVVHGGGQAIAELQSKLGLTTTKVDGLRVTDADSLRVAEMVLSGHANKLLVRALQAAGVNAIGLSGVDAGLLQCEKKQHPTADLGYVGTIVRVNGALLHNLVAQGLTPVISPISVGADHHAYNVNADEAATAVAAALPADLLDFVSNVPGVLQADQLIPQLTPAATQTLIDDGVIHGGMIPKVGAALSALEAGVAQVRIVNLAGLANGAGTRFTA
ncbi:MAG: acetylglutamate kinase [Ardenticatenales bacterium]|nr:acetylglutamate kinase [Ardenticatenales bacterium]